MDLHLHSTASDGIVPPERVPLLARAAGVRTMALTDHDTMNGVAAAMAGGADVGVRVIAGCELSVAAWWGELHLLAYFLPLGDPGLESFLAAQRQGRENRVAEILQRLAVVGVGLEVDAVVAHAGAGSMGRPHVARALVSAGTVGSVAEAFDKYLADGREAYVPRELVDVGRVVALVRSLGGVTSAAHLKQRGTRENLARLREVGVDAIEVRHPAHDASLTTRLHRDVDALGLCMTGGSDWHGSDGKHRDTIGVVDVPQAWVDAIERVHCDRVRAGTEGPSIVL